jgi:hypothetical protein
LRVWATVHVSGSNEAFSGFRVRVQVQMRLSFQVQMRLSGFRVRVQVQMRLSFQVQMRLSGFRVRVHGQVSMYLVEVRPLARDFLVLPP